MGALALPRYTLLYTLEFRGPWQFCPFQGSPEPLGRHWPWASLTFTVPQGQPERVAAVGFALLPWRQAQLPLIAS